MKHTCTAIVLTVAIVAAACSGGGGDAAPPTDAPTTTEAPTTTAAPTTTSTITTTSTTTTTVAPDEAPIRMPLTGEPVDDESQIPDRPALAVKIDNHPRGRPQAGLNEADIVFEENVENLTRFAAVFHSTDSDPVGPIRSGRSQDVGILSSFNRPLFAWSGGNAGVRALIRGAELVDLDAGFSSGYYRRSGRSGAPHNLYSSTEALWASTPDEYSIPQAQFSYLSAGDPLVGVPATVVNVAMDGVRVRWEYDAVSGKYLRFQNDARHDTELTGQVSADNVVVMGVRYIPSAVDRSSPEAQTTGVGPVFVFSRGIMRTGYWSRESIFFPFRLTFDEPVPDDDDAGDADDARSGPATTAAHGDDETDDADDDVIALVPGRTWVELARDAENFVRWE